MFENSTFQPQCTLQIMCEVRVFFVWVGLHVSLCRQQHPTSEPAVRFVCQPFFHKLRSSTPQTKSNGVRSGNSNSSVTIQNYTHVLVAVFLTMTDSVTSPKYWPFLLKPSVYIFHCDPQSASLYGFCRPRVLKTHTADTTRQLCTLFINN